MFFLVIMKNMFMFFPVIICLVAEEIKKIKNMPTWNS